jgi:predicted DNA-binding transcriptional regulator AlpA
MLRSLDLSAPKELFNTAETAHYLGVSVAKLRNSRYTGQLYGGVPTPPYLKLGRSVMYLRATLDEWIKRLPEYRNTVHQHQATHALTAQ